MLTTAGAIVTQAVVYESRDITEPNPEVLEALTAGRIDWTTVTSSAIARSIVSLFGDALRHTKLVAISPVTAEVLAGLGHPATAVAVTYTGDGILHAILAADSR
jgi:uroporphyrinogen III methyltransferase/synthase